ncbi:hypothetical protein THAOC_14288 [Thalassiosira oceanica]|uniref:Uncharacterized protein n=1 Tax=Thalassiosira oceanica TaxID=159749 RepID=K0SFK2_THAOC|nr:hypothetical protein THAOC_14288 [Thalassiosira oceanica]|eukprot:EJK64923.1 hypothetical protein THAOC_14288 [Thalassiosira oceanica]
MVPLSRWESKKTLKSRGTPVYPVRRPGGEQTEDRERQSRGRRTRGGAKRRRALVLAAISILNQSNEEHANGWLHPEEEAKRRVMFVVRSKSLGKNPAGVARKSPSNKPIKKASRKKSGTENTYRVT